MKPRTLNTHVVAILRQHSRRDELSLEEVDRLGEGVSDPEREALYSATWVEAARVWRERS